MYSIAGITADCTKGLSTLLNKPDKDRLQNMHAKPTEYKDTGDHRKVSGFGVDESASLTEVHFMIMITRRKRRGSKKVFILTSTLNLLPEMTFHFLSVLSSISSADRSAQMYWFQPPLRGEKRLSSYLPSSSPTLLILPLSSPVDGVNCCSRGKHTPTMLARRPEPHRATFSCMSWSLQSGPTRDFEWSGEAARRLTPSLKTEGNYVTKSARQQKHKPASFYYIRQLLTANEQARRNVWIKLKAYFITPRPMKASGLHYTKNKYD